MPVLETPVLMPKNVSFFINMISMMKELCEEVTIMFEERGVTFLSTNKEIYCIYISKENWINYDYKFDCTIFENAIKLYERITKQIKVMNVKTNKQNKNLCVGDNSKCIFVEKIV